MSGQKRGASEAQREMDDSISALLTGRARSRRVRGEIGAIVKEDFDRLPHYMRNYFSWGESFASVGWGCRFDYFGVDSVLELTDQPRFDRSKGMEEYRAELARLEYDRATLLSIREPFGWENRQDRAKEKYVHALPQRRELNARSIQYPKKNACCEDGCVMPRIPVLCCNIASRHFIPDILFVPTYDDSTSYSYEVEMLDWVQHGETPTYWYTADAEMESLRGLFIGEDGARGFFTDGKARYLDDIVLSYLDKRLALLFMSSLWDVACPRHAPARELALATEGPSRTPVHRALRVGLLTYDLSLLCLARLDSSRFVAILLAYLDSCFLAAVETASLPYLSGPVYMAGVQPSWSTDGNRAKCERMNAKHQTQHVKVLQAWEFLCNFLLEPVVAVENAYESCLGAHRGDFHDLARDNEGPKVRRAAITRVAVCALEEGGYTHTGDVKWDACPLPEEPFFVRLEGVHGFQYIPPAAYRTAMVDVCACQALVPGFSAVKALAIFSKGARRGRDRTVHANQIFGEDSDSTQPVDLDEKEEKEEKVEEDKPVDARSDTESDSENRPRCPYVDDEAAVGFEADDEGGYESDEGDEGDEGDEDAADADEKDYAAITGLAASEAGGRSPPLRCGLCQYCSQLVPACSGETADDPIELSETEDEVLAQDPLSDSLWLPDSAEPDDSRLFIFLWTSHKFVS